MSSLKNVCWSISIWKTDYKVEIVSFLTFTPAVCFPVVLLLAPQSQQHGYSRALEIVALSDQMSDCKVQAPRLLFKIVNSMQCIDIITCMHA